MKKEGFTLLELMIVIVVVAVIGVSAAISFTTIGDSTKTEELVKKNLSVMKAASLYVDLHDTDLKWLIENGEVYVKVSDLLNENYITIDDLDGMYFEYGNEYVKLYTSTEGTNGNCKQVVSSCIINRLYTINDNTYTYSSGCLANNKGESQKISNYYGGRCCPKNTCTD